MSREWHLENSINPLSANPAKGSNILKQFFGNSLQQSDESNIDIVPEFL